MDRPKQQRHITFDTVRGTAALLIFVYHFGAIFMVGKVPFFNTFLKAGYIGLDIFFVLSGFLIFLSVYRNGVNMQYFQRRFLRIAPIYYVSILVFLLLWQHNLFFSSDGWWNIFTHLFFIHSFFYETYHGINPVLWSLSIEMLFYVLLPLGFLFTGKRTRNILLLCGGMILATYCYRYWIMQFYGQWDWKAKVIYTENLPGRLDHFAFGMAAALLSEILRWKTKASQWIGTLCCIVGGMCAFSGMILFAQYGGGFREVAVLQIFLHSFIAFGGALLLFGLTKTFPLVQNLIGNRVLTLLGTISYSFYIWHFMVIEKIHDLHIDTRLGFLLSLFITILLSCMTYIWIEKPFLKRKRY